MMPGQSGCRSKSSNRRVVKNREMLEGVVGAKEYDGATVPTELTVLVEVAREGVRTGLPVFAGVRVDLVRDRKEGPWRVAMVAF